MPGERTEIVRKTQRVIIKVGSGLLVSLSHGLRRDFFDQLADGIEWLRGEGKEVVLVSSGAIAAGMERLGLKQRPQSISHFQATAAVGQGILMRLYEEAFDRKGMKVAQVLLTHEDIRERDRYLNARNTLFTLLEFGVVPIINENDSVAIEEIKFGDNDLLAALVAGLVDAQLLVILSHVEGLYEDGPQGRRVIPIVREITPEVERVAGSTSSQLSTGGMLAKLRAAKIVARLGIPMILAKGEVPEVLKRIWAGEEVGTLFLPHGKRLHGRKRWIGFHLRPKGELMVDEGAKEAILRRGKSLLPSGVKRVVGSFGRGDLVICKDLQGEEFARGLVNYGSEELSRIIGKKSTEIEGVLGYKYADEVIHRDNLAVL